MIDLEKLIQSGVQFGHQTWRWSPRMSRYIWGKKNGVHLIDVSKTAVQLEKASNFLEEVVANGQQVLWVGTKKAAQDIINETADRLKNPRASNRWVGGTLTNYPQVKKSVTKLLHFEDIVNKADKSIYTKKEIVSYQKVVARLEKSVGGVRNLTWPVGAVIVVDAKKEATAIKEANAMGVPVVALVDTNSDPSGVSIVIPGNDDVARSIRVIVDELAAAVERGLEKARERKAAAPTEEQLAAEQSAVEQVFGQTVEEEEEEGRTGRRAPRPRRADRASGEGLVVPDQKSNSSRRPRQNWQRTADGQPIEGQVPETPRTDGQRPAGQRPYGDRPPRRDGDRPYTPRPYGPRPEGQEGQRPEGDRPAGDRPPRPYGDRPYTPRPYGDRPPRRDGDRPYTPRPYGDRPPRRDGDRPYTPRPYGPRPEGQRPEGQEGQRPEGEQPTGDRPQRPYGDRPYTPRPYGDRPPRRDGDRPYTPRPYGDRPPRRDGDRPYTPRPYGPRPEGEQPTGDRPYTPRPYGDRPPRRDGDRPYTPRPYGDRPPRRDGDRPYTPRPYGDRPARPEGQQQPERKPEITGDQQSAPQNNGNDDKGSSTPE